MKRKALEAVGGCNKFPREDYDPTAPESEEEAKLQTAVKQLLGREVDVTDIVCEIKPAEEGMVAQLSLPTLSLMYPTEFGGRMWIGEASPTKQGTRLNAATQAL